jgi:outer membrane protein assembly factor BamB
VLDGDRLYLQLVHGDGRPETREALVLALDKLTGDEIWRHQRPSDGSMECEHSYASPVLARYQGHELLVTHGADYAVGHRLTDGAEIWRVGGLNPKNRYNPTLRFVASPVAASGLIVIPSAKNGPVVTIRITAQGMVTNESEGLVWIRSNHTPDVPSPLILDDLVYLCRENGNLLCLDAQTGSEVYHERTVSDRHRASPFYADGKIYLAARKGIVTVVQPGRTFRILAQNDMQEPISASPVVSNGVLYLRTFRALYAIREGTSHEGS